MLCYNYNIYSKAEELVLKQGKKFWDYKVDKCVYMILWKGKIHFHVKPLVLDLYTSMLDLYTSMLQLSFTLRCLKFKVVPK